MPSKLLNPLQNAHKNGTKVRLFGNIWTVKQHETTTDEHQFHLQMWSVDGNFDLIVRIPRGENA